MSYELPPMAHGTAEEQLAALRDYLVRLAGSLDRVSGEAVTSAAAGRAVQAARTEAARDIRAQAAALKALIIKNADEIIADADSKEEAFRSLYVARSDFGTYYQQIETQVAQTAREAVESYHYTEAVEALDRYVTELNGQIRRGVIEDPVTHELHLGIAVGESLSFTGQTQSEGGLTYYRLSSGQTLGLYTAAGWQFWINGVRRGWFSSEDSMLHVENIVVENTLQLGADWQLVSSDGLGLRYTGV